MGRHEDTGRGDELGREFVQEEEGSDDGVGRYIL